jgi:hypothetical protein
MLQHVNSGTSVRFAVGLIAKVPAPQRRARSSNLYRHRCPNLFKPQQTVKYTRPAPPFPFFKAQDSSSVFSLASFHFGSLYPGVYAVYLLPHHIKTPRDTLGEIEKWSRSPLHPSSLTVSHGHSSASIMSAQFFLECPLTHPLLEHTRRHSTPI